MSVSVGFFQCTVTNLMVVHVTKYARKENEVVLQWAEIRMVRWMCDVKVKDTVPSKELRERLGLDDIISVLQHSRFQWYGHVL